MDILFRSAALEKACNDSKRGQKKFGHILFAIVRRRLDDLRAATNLTELPPSMRCHPLVGDRQGSFAVRLDVRWRLVLVPANDPLPQLPSGGLDLKQITAIEIVEVSHHYE